MTTFSEYFATLIGLSAVAPNCSVNGLTSAQITQSDSGLRITDTDTLNLKLADALDDCGPDSIWPLLAKARKNALEDFYTDLLAGISSLNDAKFTPFRGNIGQEDYKGIIPTSNGQVITTTLAPNELPGAVLKLTEIGLLVDSNVDVSVKIPGLATPVIVVCSADTPSYATLPTPVLIPLEGKALNFTYVISNFSPYNNKLNCNCSVMQQRMNAYLPNLVDKPANGLLLKAELTCNPLHLITENADQMPAIYRVMATALTNKALEKTVELIQNSGVVDRYTMMESQYLWGKRNSYRKEYQDRINWLVSVDGFDMSLSSCYKTKNNGNMFVGRVAITKGNQCNDCE